MKILKALLALVNPRDCFRANNHKVWRPTTSIKMASNTSEPPNDAGAPDSSTQGEGPPTPWRSSRAKKLLFQQLCDGTTKHFSGPTAIWRSNPLYKRYEKANFCNNYRTLKKAVEQGQKGAEKSQQAYDHDLPIILQRRNEVFFWKGSDAQKQLREDVRNGFTDNKRPRQVFESNSLYCKQPGLPFRKFSTHLAHELRRREKQLQPAAFKHRMSFIKARIGDM